MYDKEMNELLEKMNSSVIETAYWDGAQLNLSGSEFAMNFACEWKLRKNEKTVMHSDYNNLKENYLDEVKRYFFSQKITGFSLSNFFIHFEPIIHIGDGYRLEIFITDCYDSWVIRLPNIVFTGDGTIISENRPGPGESFISITPGLHKMNIAMQNCFLEDDALHVVYEGKDVVFEVPWRVSDRDGIPTSCYPVRGENPLDFLDDIIAYRKSPNGDAQYFMKNGNVLECFSFQ